MIIKIPNQLCWIYSSNVTETLYNYIYNIPIDYLVKTIIFVLRIKTRAAILHFDLHHVHPKQGAVNHMTDFVFLTSIIKSKFGCPKVRFSMHP